MKIMVQGKQHCAGALLALALPALSYGAAVEQVATWGDISWDKAESGVRAILDSGRQKVLQEALLKAIEGADISRSTGLIAMGADPNWYDQFHPLPLTLAAGRGFSDVLEALLVAGAKPDIDLGQSCHQTPLRSAVSGGHLEAVKTLVARGANVNRKSCLGHTPLHDAAYWGYGEIVTFLLSSGADPNAAIYNGETPLIQAVGHYRKDAVVALLADTRVDVNREYRDGLTEGMTALKAAAKNNWSDLVEILIKAPGIDVNNRSGGVTALLLAIANNHAQIIKMLREAGAHD